MGRVNVNDVTTAISRQPSLGGTPSSVWHVFETNNPDNVADTVERETRDPISKQRSRRDSKIVRRPSNTEVSADFVGLARRRRQQDLCADAEEPAPR